MTLLPQVRASFMAAAQRETQALARSSSRRSLRMIAFAVLGLLTATAAAFAASRVLQTGSPVPAGRGMPRVGMGVPAPGGSRLLKVRSPDPAGGLAWGLREVHTTRDLICLQVGRLYRGRIGVLGQDGAFGDDGRFHPLPAQTSIGAGGHCLLGDTHTSYAISGIPASGQMPASGKLGRLSQARWISYGLLGPNAVSVAYRYGGRTRSIPVEPHTGAYLIVLAGIEPGTHRIDPGSGSSEGGSASTVLPAGAVTAITYRMGNSICEEPSAHIQVPHPCPLQHVRAPQLSLISMHDLQRPIHVRLRPAHVAGGYTATIRFTAPFAVPNALSGYSIASPSPCHEGTVADGIDRDISAGARVTVTMQGVFANACGSQVSIEVLYTQGAVGPVAGTRTVLVGRATIKRPE